MKKIDLLLCVHLFIMSCGTVSEEPVINKGSAIIAIDEAILPVIKAQISAYKIHYPMTTINPRFVSEQKAIALLLKDSVGMAATTRGLNADELKVMNSRGIKYNPARMAIDAVALIVNKDNKDSTISLEKLKYLLTDKTSKTKLIFDKSNSSNLNSIMDKLEIKEININNIYAAEGNLNVFEKIKADQTAIGFIGYNWISDTDDSEDMKLKNSVKILGVSLKNSQNYFKPSLKNLKARNYPLERFIFIHTLSKNWGVENGFIRFSCSKVGQLVTEKMGLVPFYIIPKEYILNTEPLNKKINNIFMNFFSF